jgi:uncharacterized protein YjiS (DUF1127 family)
MTHLAEASRAPHGLPARAAALLRSGWRGWRRERQLQATVATLNRLDDHLLRDIGLPRGDIEAGVRRLCR